MTSARRAVLCTVALAWIVSLGGLAACGSTKGTDGGGAAGGNGDATAEATSSPDATRVDTGAVDGGGAGDVGTGGEPGAADVIVTCSDTCPPTVECGYYTTCSGAVIACGSACAKGQVCVSNGAAVPTQACQTTTTACAGQCGVIGLDPCGVAIGCGGCPAGQECVNNVCGAPVPTEAGAVDAGCAPVSCTPSQNVNLCGKLSNVCGQTTTCTCPAGQQCYGGVAARRRPSAARPTRASTADPAPSAARSRTRAAAGPSRAPPARAIPSATTARAPRAPPHVRRDDDVRHRRATGAGPPSRAGRATPARTATTAAAARR